MVSEFDSNNEKSKRRTVDVKSKPTGMRKTGALPKKAENFSESIVVMSPVAQTVGKLRMHSAKKAIKANQATEPSQC